MVRAWYMDACEDQQLENQRCPPAPVPMDILLKNTGVEYFKIDIKTMRTDPVLNAMKKDRGYSYEDEITCSRETLCNYEESLKTFFKEHLHDDEEIRLVLEGSGFFDVRDGKQGDWIRIEVVPGDLIVIPGGCYHRFTLDTKNYIKAVRYFVGAPVWKPYNKPDGDEMICRNAYLKKLNAGLA